MNETAGKILKILEDRKEPVSGEEISRILGITRSAVWKDIKELKALGYSINSSRTDGYELVSATAGLLPHEIEKYLKTRFIGRDIRYFEKTESTTWVAKDLCVKNDISTLDGTVIIAEEQTGGYGRLGRAWASPKGGIWTTIILKPDISVDRLFFITMAASIAVARTIRNMYDVGALIKWPNDIFIGDKKVCGIYLEISAEADVIHHCLLGIGIDANVKPEVFHNNVPVAVTSLKDETGADINRVEFFAQFLQTLQLHTAQQGRQHADTPSLRRYARREIQPRQGARAQKAQQQKVQQPLDQRPDRNDQKPRRPDVPQHRKGRKTAEET